jgi:hypothetical protein
MFALACASPAASVDFDPVKHGLAEPSRGMILRDPGMTCTFLRNAVEGTKKVWTCDDGSTRYGDRDVWSHPGDPKPETETVDEDFDPAIKVPGHSFMTITTLDQQPSLQWRKDAIMQWSRDPVLQPHACARRS